MAAVLAWLGGANNDILRKVPTEQSRFVQMALVLLTTSCIGMVSMMFALDDGVHTPLPVAIIGGISWGLIILNLDRFLVLSMGHTRDWKKLLLMALPRLALAAVISIVVATPMTLRIFQHDISNQMAIQQTNESAKLNKTEPKTILAKDLNKVNVQIAKWNNVLAGNLEGIKASTPQLADDQKNVSSLTTQVNAAQTKMNSAYDKWNCEVHGAGTNCAAGSSRTPGDGPRAQNDYMTYVQDKTSYDSLSSQLNSARTQESAAQQQADANANSTLTSQQAVAREKLPGLRQEQATLEKKVNQQLQSNARDVNSNNGILAQLQALSDAGSTDPVLAGAQLMVTLLFFFIEILPVLVKFLLNIGPLSLYEIALKNEENLITDTMKTSRVTRRQDIEREALKQQAIDEDMRQREEALGKMANAHVAAHMETILKQALTNWSVQVQSQLGGQLTGGAPDTGHPAPRPVGSGSHRRLSLTGPIPVVRDTDGPGYGYRSGAADGNGTRYGTSTAGRNGTVYGNNHGHNGASGGDGKEVAANGHGAAAAYPTVPGAGSGFILPADNGDLL